MLSGFCLSLSFDLFTMIPIESNQKPGIRAAWWRQSIESASLAREREEQDGCGVHREHPT